MSLSKLPALFGSCPFGRSEVKIISLPSVEMDGAKSLYSVFNELTLSTHARMGSAMPAFAILHSFLRFVTNLLKLSAFL